jgi:hypothetical protein
MIFPTLVLFLEKKISCSVAKNVNEIFPDFFFETAKFIRRREGERNTNTRGKNIK